MKNDSCRVRRRRKSDFVSAKFLSCETAKKKVSYQNLIRDVCTESYRFVFSMHEKSIARTRVDKARFPRTVSVSDGEFPFIYDMMHADSLQNFNRAIEERSTGTATADFFWCICCFCSHNEKISAFSDRPLLAPL